MRSRRASLLDELLRTDLAGSDRTERCKILADSVESYGRLFRKAMVVIAPALGERDKSLVLSSSCDSWIERCADSYLDEPLIPKLFEDMFFTLQQLLRNSNYRKYRFPRREGREPFQHNAPPDATDIYWLLLCQLMSADERIVSVAYSLSGGAIRGPRIAEATSSEELQNLMAKVLEREGETGLNTLDLDRRILDVETWIVETFHYFRNCAVKVTFDHIDALLTATPPDSEGGTHSKVALSS